MPKLDVNETAELFLKMHDYDNFCNLYITLLTTLSKFDMTLDTNLVDTSLDSSCIFK